MSLKPCKDLDLEIVLSATETWLTLEWHKVHLWLKVYCEVKDAVWRREAKLNKWIFATFLREALEINSSPYFLFKQDILSTQIFT